MASAERRGDDLELGASDSHLFPSRGRFDLEKFGSQLEDVRLGVEKRLQQWAEYERALERLLGWLADAEAALKNYQPRGTLEEKREQLDKYEALIGSLRQNEAELDKISDESSELAQSSGESRVTVSLQQVTSRFQSAQATAKVCRIPSSPAHPGQSPGQFGDCFSSVRRKSSRSASRPCWTTRRTWTSIASAPSGWPRRRPASTRATSAAR